MGATARGLPYPEPTDFVTDGAAAIQALAEATQTQLDAEEAQASAAFVPKSLADAAGDLLVADAADTFTRLAKGAALQVLRVNAAGTALEYAAPAAAGGDLIKIAEVSLGAAASSISFTAIPGTYKHLALRFAGRGDAALFATPLLMRLNSDTGANYDWEQIRAFSTTLTATESLGATSLTLGLLTAASANAGNATAGRIDLPGYAGTTFHKGCVSHLSNKQEAAANGMQAFTNAGSWRNAAAVTAVTLLPASGSFIAGTVATLYGMS